jgi:hypothetical protein
MRSLLLLVAFVPGLANARPCEGTVYEKDSHRQIVLFDWKLTETKEGTALRKQTTFTAPDKSVAATEDVLVEGELPRKFTVHQNQTGETGTLEVKGKKVLFSYTKEGKTKTSEEDLEDSLVVGPTLIDYLQARKAKLLEGGKVDIRFAVLDRRETVGFSFFKVSEDTYEGKPTVTIKMEPTSFIIAALVDPLLFTFYKEDMKLLEIIGRTLPKRKDGEKWKDLDADIWYRC